MMVVVLFGAGCSSSSSSKSAVNPPTTAATSASATDVPVAPNKARPRLPLEFREVKFAVSASGVIKAQGPTGSSDQHCSTLVTPPANRRSDTPSEMLYDRPRANCYLLGPDLVPASSVGSASVHFDPSTSSWVVGLGFKNDDFRVKVVRPLSGKRLAVVLAGFVQALPVVDASSTGRTLDVGGGFTRAGALDLAAVIMGVAPSAVKVTAPSS